MKRILLTVIFLLGILIGTTTAAENGTDEIAPKLFISGSDYDSDYIRKEITFVNYVIDRKDADIHVLITRQSTGSGGREYTLLFIGQNHFEARDDTLTYTTLKEDTWDDVRNKMVKSLKIGLMQYIAQTPISDDISIHYSDAGEAMIKRDNWNNWVFSLRLSGSLSGQKYSSDASIDGSLSARRVTEDWKIILDLDTEYDEEHYQIDEDEVVSTKKEYDFDFGIVRSLGSHWSIGFAGELQSNTYSNIEFAYDLKPAIEYNLFPYSESTHRQLRFVYSIGYENVQYVEETIYNKMRENILEESLGISLELTQPWGSVNLNLSGEHSFYDFDKNRLTLHASTKLHLYKGLSLYFHGGVSMIHDQYSLPKRDASPEEIFLKRRQLETNYSYWSGMGIEFTFGSIYNNIVNPRFGD